nr:flippase [uncultured Albidiferax sp.]
MLTRNHFTHIALNVSGVVLPMLVGVAVVPGLIHRLGQDRFGALTLAWTLVGYFGLLDLGLGRALTQYLSQHNASGMPLTAQAAMARLARRLMCGLGATWALLLLVFTPWVGTAIQMPVEVRTEAPAAWAMLATAIPFLMWSTCSTGVLEARSRFTAVNSVRIPSGIASFCVPWLIALYSVDLRAVMAGLLLVRIGTALAFAWLAKREFAHASHAPPSNGLRQLLHFGGWLTVSNLAGPLLSYFDRFAIAALLSTAAVTHYTVPFDVLSRLPAIPVAMLGVLFPLLAHAQGNSGTSAVALPGLIRSATHMLVACWLPGLIGLTVLGPWLLHWWVGPEIAQRSSMVWQWLAVGVLVNGFAHIPYNLLQSAGRTDLIAKIHLFELLPYGVGLWWALLHWGIVGAASVWTLRVVADTLLLFKYATHQFPALQSTLRTALLWAAAGATIVTLLGTFASPVAIYTTTPVQPPWQLLALVLACALASCGYQMFQFSRKK